MVVLFLVARVKNNLVDILTSKLENLSTLLPDELLTMEEPAQGIQVFLAVPLSYFDCGGIYAFHIKLQMRVPCQASSMTGLPKLGNIGCGCLSSLCSTQHQYWLAMNLSEIELMKANVVTRRYIFHRTIVFDHKANIASDSKAIHNTTLVQAVLSFKQIQSGPWAYSHIY